MTDTTTITAEGIEALPFADMQIEARKSLEIGETVELYKFGDVVVLWLPEPQVGLVNQWSSGIGDSLIVECSSPGEAAERWGEE